MRVTKDQNGQFAVQDDPTELTGEAASKFLEAMSERDRVGNSQDDKQFLERCREVYRASEDRKAK
jgi:hypothetical protein